MSSLPLPIAAFVAGLISFLSVCVIALVPGYVSLISGAGVEELKSPQAQLMRRLTVNSFGFIFGFSVAFVALGSISTEIGQIAARYNHSLSIAEGAVIVIFGLYLTGIVENKVLYTPICAFVIGFAFAFRWTPCIGPIFSAILTLTVDPHALSRGMVLLAIYSLGLAVPFLLISLLMERVLCSHMHALKVTSGSLVIAVGVLMVILQLVRLWR
jgi:cytochrome c-type biogenesis protein